MLYVLLLGSENWIWHLFLSGCVNRGTKRKPKLDVTLSEKLEACYLRRKYFVLFWPLFWTGRMTITRNVEIVCVG